MIEKTILVGLLLQFSHTGHAAMVHDDPKDSMGSMKMDSSPAADQKDSMGSMKMDASPAADHKMAGMLGTLTANQEASGTSWQPASTPMHGVMGMAGKWMTMVHGYATAIYSHREGPRGGDTFFSTNMLMAMASRPLGVGTFGVRGMFSLEPSLGPAGYPLLLQTGESADGSRPLIDRQHPHDLFMELAMTYSMPLTDGYSLFGYLGLPGEPALGPPAFMHRFSGLDNPMAPLNHHWIDGTHITQGVATLGVIARDFKLDASAFRGREPDYNRWDIEQPRLDSWSGRLSYNPAKNVALQASYGHLVSPEALKPTEDENKIIVSAMLGHEWKGGVCQSTLGWGQNRHASGGGTSNSYFLESAVNMDMTHTLFMRAESAEKEGLFEDSSPMAGQMFTVGQLTLGYIYDFPALGNFQTGIGASGTANFIPEALTPFYGSQPLSYLFFLRLKAV